MGFIELLMIGVLVGCAVALIVLFSKKKSDDDMPPKKYVPRGPGSYSAPAPGGIHPAPDLYRSPAPTPMMRPEPTTFRPPAPPAPSPAPASKKVATSLQHTIYVFERRGTVPKCPRCDGEYDISKEVCCICGYQFRKGVRYS